MQVSIEIEQDFSDSDIEVLSYMVSDTLVKGIKYLIIDEHVAL